MVQEETLKHQPAPGKLGALLLGRCPRCRTGKVFTHSVLSLKFQEMHKNCPVCGQDFEIEPGFYWGSMYISYAITVIIELIIVILVYYLFNDPDVWVYLTVIGVTLLLMSPFLFRLSRMFMLTFFASVKYDPKALYNKKAR